MTRRPLLEQLRVQRHQAEEEASTAVRAELSVSRSQLYRTEQALLALERVATSSFGKVALERIAVDVARELRIKIADAAAAVRPRSRKRVATIRIPLDVLRFSDPNSLERQLLDHWARTAPAQLYTHARVGGPGLEEDAILLQVTVPKITRGIVVSKLA